MMTLEELKEKGLAIGLSLNKKELKEVLNSSSAEDIHSIIYLSYVRHTSKKTLKLKKKEIHEEKIRIQKKSKLESVAEEYRNKLVTNQTEFEKKFKALLKSVNIAYEFQKIFYVGKSFYIVDFYLPTYNKIIELDGYHHKLKENKRADSIRAKHLLNEGKVKEVIRFWNDDSSNTEFIIKQLKHHLNL